MDHQVLARKLRPKRFADLVGQEHVTRALLNSIEQFRLHHAYLLTGTRGVGKTTIARILAKSLNCSHVEHGEPCGQCDNCISIDEGRFVDLLEIDAASNTGIDNIREVLDNAQYMPTVGRYKVYIIDEVHMLSKSAFNAMLKTLEEPPPHVKFILATTDPHKVPVTVLSRCLQFVLKNLTSEQIYDYLKQVMREENINYEDPSVYLIARAASGSMRDALSLLDQSIALGNGALSKETVQKMLGVIDRDFLYDIFLALHQDNKAHLYNKINELRYESVGFNYLLDEMALILKDLAIKKLFSVDLYPDTQKFNLLANALSDEEIQLYYQTIINGKKDQVIAPDEYTGFLMIVMRMLSFKPYFALDVGSYNDSDLSQASDLNTKKKIVNQQSRADNSEMTEKATHSNTDLVSDQVVVSNQHTKMEANSLITAETWVKTIQKVNTKIGPNVRVTHNMALIQVLDGQIICALQNEHSFKEILPEAKRQIEKAFLELFSVKVQWSAWTENLISYANLKKIQQADMQRLGLEYLNSDKIANKLKELFNGEWDINSIQFKENE